MDLEESIPSLSPITMITKKEAILSSHPTLTSTSSPSKTQNLKSFIHRQEMVNLSENLTESLITKKIKNSTKYESDCNSERIRRDFFNSSQKCATGACRYHQIFQISLQSLHQYQQLSPHFRGECQHLQSTTNKDQINIQMMLA